MHPPTNALKKPLQQHFHDLLDLWNQFQYLNPTDIAPQISHNLGNFDSVLQDVLKQFPDDARNIQSILFLNRFYHRTQLTYSPLLSNLMERMPHWQNTPILGDYLLEQFGIAGHDPIMDPERQIALGNEFFKSKASLEQAKWSFALGTYFMWENADMDCALDCFHHAVSLSDSTGSPSPIAERALTSISTIMFNTGHPLRALVYAKKDEEYAGHLGDIYEQARSLYLQSRCSVIFTNYQHAQILLRSASNLWMSCGLPHGGQLDMGLRHLEAEIHLRKTEYLESHQIQISIISNLQPRPTEYFALMASLNIALIDIATGVDSKVILEMNNIQNTLWWAGIFLSLALTSKERLAEMKALSYLGQISVAEGDDETALSLFTVALDGFTFMDVHRWRAACMVQIADIYDKRGEPVKSVELWKTAQPLFERSSQTNSVTWIDVRLAEVASAVSEKHEKQLQQLAKMNVLAGKPEETKIGAYIAC
ncbi:hypothetical protein C8J57DRAFT_1495097 [Mycena rebaudengoi]|nr:hypothetical protein C8J57DRAFT_1495097 [Mycena rebaudengoi]